MKHFFISLILCCLMLSASAASSPNDKKISEISKQIADVQRNLQQTLTQQNMLQQKLEQAEKSIGSLSDRIQTINQKIAKNNQQLKTLTAQAEQYQTQLASQQNELAKQMRLAYQNAHQDYLKILLNQQNPYELSRILTYYQYFAQAHLQTIHELNQTLAAIQQNQQAIELNTHDLKDLLATRMKQQQQLQQSRNNRKQILTQLHNKAETQQQRLTTLQANKQALENVIVKLRQAQVNQPFVGGDFASMKGRMNWPLGGKVIRHFGQPMNQSLLYNDVFIQAAQGQNIQAVAPGKIVFANWLKGFGLLLIIDHGNGYMTLYAHCNSLYKNVGDTVVAREVIASAGNSGGFDTTGVSFQIRHNGTPLNPAQWCK